MEKTIKLNGEFTIAELEQKIKEAKEPVWTIEKGGINNHYYIYKNGISQECIWNQAMSFQENYSQLIYRIANAMGVLASKEEILKTSTVELVYFNVDTTEFTCQESDIHIYGTAIKYCYGKSLSEFINNSPLMKEFE